LTPRHPFPALGAGFNPVSLENVGDRRPTDSMPEILQGTLDSSISPPGILSGHSNRQLLDYLHDPTSPWGAALVSPLLGYELPVPTENGVGSDERGDLGKRASADGLASHSQSASLIVGQPESSAAELLLEDAILLAEILNDRILLAADPAREGGDQNLPGLKDDGHPGIVARRESDRQLSSTV